MRRDDSFVFCIDVYEAEKNKFLHGDLSADVYLNWKENFVKSRPRDIHYFNKSMAFLENQKRIWHKLALRDLYKAGRLSNHFKNARYFLDNIYPDNEKQIKLTNHLFREHNKHMDIANGIYLILTILESDMRHYVNKQITEEDKEFLKFYKAKLRVGWCVKAGLWRYIQEPAEGDESKSFYSSVSDYYLCLIDGFSNLEELVVKHILERKELAIN